MMTEKELDILLSCIDSEDSFLQSAAKHGIDTRLQRATLYSLQAKLIGMLQEMKAPKE